MNHRTVIAALCFCTVMGTTSAASAQDGPVFPYKTRAFHSGSCSGQGQLSSPTDPINAVFVQRTGLGGAANVSDLIADRGLKWGDTTATGSDGWIANDDRTCKKQDVAQARGFKFKHHTRLFDLKNPQNNGQDVVTLLNPHIDRKRFGCGSRLVKDFIPFSIKYKGQYISGFDYGQREMANAYRNLALGRRRAPRRVVINKCNYKTDKRENITFNGYQEFFRLSENVPSQGLG